MNINNLKKLADFVEKNVTQEMFDMAQYRLGASRDLTYKDLVENKNCGTVGCLLGWSPFSSDNLAPSKFDEGEDGSFSWSKYCERVFSIEMHDAQWDFLFSGEWRDIDNTVKGAVERINYLCQSPHEEMIEIYREDYEDEDSATFIPEGFPMPSGCAAI